MILIDTTPLVALCESNDEKHRVAIRHLASLKPFAVCAAVLTEACVHLPHRFQRQRLAALLDRLGVRPAPAEQERGYWREVFNWLDKYADHEPDWADACLAVLSERDRDSKVWTYDREFLTTWRRPDGSAIPLAVKAI